MNSHRGQTALEFVVLAGFMLFIFSAFALFIKERSSITMQQARYSELAATADALEQEVSNANRVQDGYSRLFELPTSLNAESYTVTANANSEIAFKTSNEEYILFLPANISVIDADGHPTPTIKSGRLMIKKFDGNITLQSSVKVTILCQFLNPKPGLKKCTPYVNGVAGATCQFNDVDPDYCTLPPFVVDFGQVVTFDMQGGGTVTCDPLPDVSIEDASARTVTTCT
jgi:hypothetical protein